MWSVSAAIMAYNEAASLPAFFDELHAVLEGTGRPYEILIVDDGSTDGTGAIADAIAARHARVRVIHHPENRGLGEVYRTAYFGAANDLIACFPADGQFPADIVAQFLPYMDAHDMVLGYVEERTKAGRLSVLLSTAEKAVYRLLFGRLPRFRGIILFRRSILEELPLRSVGRGWGIVMELIIRTVRSGYRTRSLPTSYRPRTHGSSKVNNLRTIVANLRQVLGLVGRL